MSDQRPAGAIFDVTGTKVVVTGGGSGIGLAIATVLAESGAVVTIADADLVRVQDEMVKLLGAGCDVRGAHLDVGDREKVAAFFASLEAERGGVDVVFANAGISGGPGFGLGDGAIDAFDIERYDRSMRVNLDGALFTMRNAAAVMKRQGSGKIIATASTAGLRAEAFVSYAYLGAKAALVNIVRQASLELAPFGVTVNAIAPGPFRTRISGGETSPEMAKKWSATVPLGRMGDTDELKGLALLLASSASSYITGAVIPIDGGALAAGQPLPGSAA